MPAGGLDGLPRAELLTDDEIIRLVRIAVTSLGVTEVRLTGGEPPLRPGLPTLVGGIAALRPPPATSASPRRHRPGPAGAAAASGRAGPAERVPGHLVT